MSEPIAADLLKQFVDKVDRLEDQKAEIGEEIKLVMAEAKSQGFDTKILRQVVRLQRMKPHDRVEQQELLEIYTAAVGLV
jgi:uncharacterized protein (UPF0335 family)